MFGDNFVNFLDFLELFLNELWNVVVGGSGIVYFQKMAS